MKLKSKILIALVVILNFSCENLNDPGKIQIKNSVFLNLKVNSQQKFYIYNTLDFETMTGGEFSLKDFDKYFVENAEIIISDSLNTYGDFVLATDTSGVRYYTLLSNENFNANTLYHLSVSSNGQNFGGNTTTPGNFNIISPGEGEVINSSGNKFIIDIVWSDSKNSKGYNVNVSYKYFDAFFNGYLTASFDKVVFDTLYTFTGYFYVDYPVDSVSIEISSFDENYFNHVYNGNDESGITGAYGYFGSSVLRTRKIAVE